MSSIPLDLLRSRGGFSRDARFAGRSAPLRGAAADAAPIPDPEMEAYARGYAEGLAHAEEQAKATERERDERRAAIELAFARFDEQSAIELRERLRQTVHALCEEVIVPLSLDADLLSERVEKAAAMLQRAQDDQCVLLNPDDVPLVEGRLSPALSIRADPSVERGALRIETEDGGIEDGPIQWRRILAEAFREC